MGLLSKKWAGVDKGRKGVKTDKNLQISFMDDLNLRRVKVSTDSSVFFKRGSQQGVILKFWGKLRPKTLCYTNKTKNISTAYKQCVILVSPSVI